ncbi:hypothetical protein LP421_19735 [Rhizobium sp. RCAM05350]|nr:hypothetical protein LP421_19735 [Rhizobium sp. RCAM05350]
MPGGSITATPSSTRSPRRVISDQAVRGSISPFLNSYSTALTPWSPLGNQDSYSAYIQGLLLGPHMLASRERSTNLLEEPFFETELTGGFVTGGRETTYTGGAEIRGLTFSPFPISINADFSWTRPRDEVRRIDDGNVLFDTDITSGTGYITMSPTPGRPGCGVYKLCFVGSLPQRNTRHNFRRPDPGPRRLGVVERFSLEPYIRL